ncbi:MAG: hypothetical protein AAB391_03790 [Patescibacteria group bacterium]
MSYLNWNTEIVTDFSPATLDALYEQGYVATRVDKGTFNQTRSVRIRLADFELSSENRRILRKVEKVTLEAHPLPYTDYHWSIHKLAKDFYTTKFGEDTFSANKAKELLTEADKSSFNALLVFREGTASGSEKGRVLGYCIALKTSTLLHYSYPFYKLDEETAPGGALSSLGLGMMTKAIEWAKTAGPNGQSLEYVYLGSLQRPTDTYKLQFSGLEWFDGEKWWKDIEPLKEVLK